MRGRPFSGNVSEARRGLARPVRNGNAVLALARRFLEARRATRLVSRVHFFCNRLCVGRPHGRTLYRRLRTVSRSRTRFDRGALHRVSRRPLRNCVRTHASRHRTARRGRSVYDLRVAAIDRRPCRTFRSARLHTSRYAAASDRRLRRNLRGHVRPLRARRVCRGRPASQDVATAGCGRRVDGGSHAGRVGILAGACAAASDDSGRCCTGQHPSVVQMERARPGGSPLYGDDARLGSRASTTDRLAGDRDPHCDQPRPRVALGVFGSRAPSRQHDRRRRHRCRRS